MRSIWWVVAAEMLDVGAEDVDGDPPASVDPHGPETPRGQQLIELGTRDGERLGGFLRGQQQLVHRVYSGGSVAVGPACFTGEAAGLGGFVGDSFGERDFNGSFSLARRVSSP
jgi:hypothetical protein